MRGALLVAVTGLMAVSSPACGQTRSAGGGAQDSAKVARRLGRGERWATDFSRITVPVEEIVSGGPPKDGIPSIDSPRFEDLAAADRWLEDREPVIVLELEGETRIYPLRILIRHEIVNDVVAGRPVTITYCPLCNTSLVFEGTLDGRRLDFGTTGRLRNSDLVMYDRQTESWWQQASGEALVGELAGTVLDFLPANTLPWEMASRLYPDARVLSRNTGFSARYGANPYVGYDSGSGPYRDFFKLKIDKRFPALDRVASIDLGSGWAAPFSELQQTHVAEGEVQSHPFVVFWRSGMASAVDAGSIPKGRDVGASAAFNRRLGERTLSFEWRDSEHRDRETGSTWDFAGRATAGPLVGERLVPIAHGNPFWFAWAAFRPDTEVWRAP